MLKQWPRILRIAVVVAMVWAATGFVAWHMLDPAAGLVGARVGGVRSQGRLA